MVSVPGNVVSEITQVRHSANSSHQQITSSKTTSTPTPESRRLEPPRQHNRQHP
eukprot:CAMPEP_0184678214 /NCGR_PEP_ID=MMETSP0312-20130426/924_1 /TAXON_ID=31354 /ORGANISM="Compsopogon coeruleus, Strain SAG 36.94" /LENGTH=53 /DNA_ID=CAMNT_0027126759 /DNA_START=10 /DNA_END=167 /DNA_ORIENTATION=-